MNTEQELKWIYDIAIEHGNILQRRLGQVKKTTFIEIIEKL